MSEVKKTDYIRELNICLRRLSYSTAGYILVSNPYITENDKKAVAAVREMAESDSAQALECAELIESLDGVPQTGMADPMLAELNYLSYPFLLDKLVDETEKEIAELEQAHNDLGGHAEAQKKVEQFLDTRRAQIKKLRDIRQSNYSEIEQSA